MKIPKKTSWITALIATIVPFISAVITSIYSPPADKDLYYIILGLLMAISWLVSTAVISNVSRRKMKKMNLLPKTDNDTLSVYWRIVYGHSNCSNIPCSVLKLMYQEEFEGYRATLYDYEYDTSNEKIVFSDSTLSTIRCKSVFFGEDENGIAKIAFESSFSESKQDNFMIEHIEEGRGRLKRLTLRCSSDDVTMSFCYGDIIEIRRNDIVTHGIRKESEARRAYNQGHITPQQLVGYMNKCYKEHIDTIAYDSLRSNVRLASMLLPQSNDGRSESASPLPSNNDRTIRMNPQRGQAATNIRKKEK